MDQRSEYGSREPGKLNGVEGDETEDLYDLLLTVKVCTFILVYYSSNELSPAR